MKIVEYEDYIDILHKEFSEIDRNSIREVLKFGSGKMLYYRHLGADLFFKDDVNLKFFMYIGQITKDPYKRNAIYFKKKRKKLRHMYALDKIEYNGYFYFGLTDAQNEIFEKTKTIDKTIYYKVEKEAFIKPTANYIYKVKMNNPNKWFLLKENYKENNAVLHTVKYKKNETSST